MLGLLSWEAFDLESRFRQDAANRLGCGSIEALDDPDLVAMDLDDSLRVGSDFTCERLVRSRGFLGFRSGIVFHRCLGILLLFCIAFGFALLIIAWFRGLAVLGVALRELLGVIFAIPNADRDEAQAAIGVLKYLIAIPVPAFGRAASGALAPEQNVRLKLAEAVAP